MITLGCVQSSYMPWRGYFDIIRKSDVFVFHDDIQYTKQDWRNRNRIKSANGPIWLTVPVQANTIAGAIDEVLIDFSRDWNVRHWRQIEANYRCAPFFKEYGPVFRDLLLSGERSLSRFNILCIRTICEILEIKTSLVHSRELSLSGKKTDRLIAMCRAVGANRYISGPSARSYLEPQKLSAGGIELVYMDYQYPVYPQLFDGFRGDLSIVDLILNCGRDSRSYF